MLDLNTEKDEFIYNQKCSNKNCNSMLSIDGEYQNDLDFLSEDILIKGIAVIKINKKTKNMKVKCKSCKEWTLLKLKVVLC